MIVLSRFLGKWWHIKRSNTDCWFTLLVLLFFLEILKKKEKKSSEKKSSENDQLTGHFQSFFILFLFVPPTLNLKKKNYVNQLIKKFLPYSLLLLFPLCVRILRWITVDGRGLKLWLFVRPTWVNLLDFFWYSVLCTVESLSLLYLLFISWFICSKKWCMDKLGVFHANQTSMCLDPHRN